MAGEAGGAADGGGDGSGDGGGVRRAVVVVVLGALCAPWTLAGCGGGGGATARDAAVDWTAAGMCGEGLSAEQQCTTLVDNGAAVVPTCATETMPAGQGGTIAGGTYVLTAQTYYNVNFCPSVGLSQTIHIAGDCLETASGLFGKAAARLTLAGSSLTTATTCVYRGSDAGGGAMAGPSIQTFTATDTTFTLFTDYTDPAQPGSDNVAVYTRR